MNKKKKILLSTFLSITSVGLMTTSVLGNLFDHQKSGNNYSSEKKKITLIRMFLKYQVIRNKRAMV